MIGQDVLNIVLGRKQIRDDICHILNEFEHTQSKRGIYLYGNPGCGKTYFILELLKYMNFDTITYDAGDIRNKSLFSNIDNNHISSYNVLDLMKRKKRKIAIFMDEIDGMNSGDKGGLDALIRLIRPKKTKKQKTEIVTMNPVICIGNHENDKKIRELMSVCHVFKLTLPTDEQIQNLLSTYLLEYVSFSETFREMMIKYIQGDLRKLFFLIDLSKRKPILLKEHILYHIFHVKLSNEDAKTITKTILQSSIPLESHNSFMNETDRTTISLLWHENVYKKFHNTPNSYNFPFYKQILHNISFADYIGRITFQSQIWQFNEMTSLIKTFYNNTLLHAAFPSTHNNTIHTIEFTKVLTKYSTEYNNQLFIQGICHKLFMDKKDVFGFFHELRIAYGKYFYLNSQTMSRISPILTRYEIDILDIKRICRFLDKNVKREDDCEKHILEDFDDD